MRKAATRQRVTIIDVARKAGMSSSTVSNVFNGRFGAMTAETLERGPAAIRDLNFRPRNTARCLVTRRSAAIGLILADIETPRFLKALNHIVPIARNAGYNVRLWHARNMIDEREAVNLLLEKEVDGISFLSTSQYLEELTLIVGEHTVVEHVLLPCPLLVRGSCGGQTTGTPPNSYGDEYA